MLVSRNDDGGVTTLTLNRPDKLNAIDIPLMAELREHIAPRQQARRGGGRG